MPSLDAIFKAYDVRGTVPDQLDPELAHAIGVGFATFAREESEGRGESVTRVLMARDMRPSGVELSAAFADGVRSQGLDVVDLGLGSTDLLYFASGSMGAPGVMFTASHNPAQYNGAKFCLSGARPVGEDTGLGRIREVGEASLAGSVPAAATTGTISSLDVLGAFADHVRSFVDVSSLAPLQIVADTANGMGGLIVPAVFSSLPFQLEVMYGELDGTFPNHPADPIQPANTEDLRRRVVEAGADVGLAFDGDADRVFLVDEKGVGLSGSTTTAIIAAGILDKNPGGTVIHNLICSRTVPEVVREHGGTPVRTRVGHSFIKQVMAEEGAVFGGEHSAHYYFRDNFRADSGIIAALLVLEQMSVAGTSLSELRAPFERYADSGEINTRVDDPAAVIERVAEHFSDLPQDRLDGLTVDGGDWWFNLRPSNTEPLLRLNLEAPDAEACTRRTEEVRALLTA
ncbi:MAG TPA: phosphomannomutase/phosphoglucomutase [Microthrixaceae bacterium]|nr:phosphomannomutase/phosphoglucomutase [Microthrixaceae bacterium]MCB9400573.1 phosphomannomutase/phosphoglucomutase [Microthrixaceae bacterium]MCO5306111.1 phosphomannomutase/phosphoglucomutase [Microthrixaceae bacterium]HMX66636.1 phosphomannomutase/phosphoglucomutase [Microthrixaceae bacterium]HMY87236.1 phosphomannomutase/phosphoglucomutase [Microthrixaceae bacterium]